MVKKIVVTILAGLLLPGACSASSIAYSKVKIGKYAAHVVIADLRNPEVKVSVALAKGGTGRQETFKSIVKRVKPSSAITGTFFDTRSLLPTGDIAVYGSVVYSGCIGSACCIDKNNKPSIVPLREGRKHQWSDYETVLCAGPTLVSQGRVSISLKRDGFRGSLHAPARRTAVGITASGKLVIAAINRDCSLHQIAKLMVKVGCVGALCLDGGSSTGFYSSGKFMAVPSRSLTNLIVVYSSQASYQAARTVDSAPVKMAQTPAAAVAPAYNPFDLSLLYAAAFPASESETTMTIQSPH